MTNFSDGFLFEQIARLLFEAETVKEAATATAAKLREILGLHRVIFVDTYTGSPRIIAYAGDEDFTAEWIEDYFLSKKEELHHLLKLTQPLFIHDYIHHEGALKAFVETGSVSVALIPFVGRTKSELGLITMHRNAQTQPWDETIERILVAVAQLIFMGIQRLYYLEEHQRLLYTDELTGVGNRRAFMLDMETHLSAKDPFCLAIFDFDDFKSINDNYGHLAGDFVLQKVSNELQRLLGIEHKVYRLGGDEFAIYYASDQLTEVENVLQRLISQLDLSSLGEMSFRAGFSLGYASAQESNWNLDQLISIADKRMYRQKRMGKLDKEGRS
ncbi:GGDEF domain-containing protein [Sulfoacidibacillus thermotolerans]|uniref:GGDEF domain-containing protein n=1 Tax=Sulfoacidibacillus thermotolerans TaxID=1765684 RepID=A0A2U3D867_SULT2|nr:sensor domain-containing diguanylate cyclase [Sulfoacidibacillus thermotolerans]PWI57470.1 hypothetical protein BM613_08320 [Sulfoacidibacillus thermotolerans]